MGQNTGVAKSEWKYQIRGLVKTGTLTGETTAVRTSVGTPTETTAAVVREAETAAVSETTGAQTVVTDSNDVGAEGGIRKDLPAVSTVSKKGILPRTVRSPSRSSRGTREGP